jgi:hypothetical protein
VDLRQQRRTRAIQKCILTCTSGTRGLRERENMPHRTWAFVAHAPAATLCAHSLLRRRSVPIVGSDAPPLVFSTKPVAPVLPTAKARCGIYFRGLPRFANINPRASAVQRSWLANLSASLRSGPGGIRRASSNASAARLSQSSLSGRCCVSLLIAPQGSRSLDLSRSFDSKTLISAMLFP